MKKGIFTISLTLSTIFLFAGTTPQTITMDGGTNIATAFGGDGTLGSDGATYYAHWDATYLYLGWSGGNTIYSSDLYYAAIDVVDGSGSTGAIEGVDFDASTPDFYVVYENNSNFYGIPATNGNAYEIYQDNGSNGWNFVSRTGGDDGTSSQIDFAANEVRLRIEWATLGVAPGASQGLGLTFWTNNSNGSFMWGKFPSNNPATGGTPKTMTHKLRYTSTADGTNPSTAGTSVTLSTPLPVEVIDFKAYEKNEVILLSWNTATEINNSHFLIERSSDSHDFEVIAEIAGAGNSFEENSYQFSDKNPVEGLNYYRLTDVSFAGEKNQSKIISINFSVRNDLQLFPNPVNDFINLKVDSNSEKYRRIEIFNSFGKLLITDDFFFEKGKNQMEIQLPDLPKGAYFLRVGNAVERFLKN